MKRYLAIVLAIPGVASAVNIDLTSTMPGGASWLDGVHWSDGQPAHAGGDYFVPGIAALPGIARSPNNGANDIFGGDSLELGAGGIMRLKGVTGTIITFPDLRLNGGILHNGNNGSAGNGFVQNVLGSINVLAPSMFDIGEMTNQNFNDSSSNANQFRRLVVSSTITGGGLLTVGLDPADGDANDITAANFAGMSLGVELMGVNNTFSGGWNVIGGILRGIADESLGVGDVAVGPAAGFDADYDVLLPSSSFVLDGVWNLDQGYTFGTATIGGIALAPGNYSAAQLVAQFPNHIVSTSVGFLTVIPEPAGLAWIGLVSLAIVRRRRPAGG